MGTFVGAPMAFITNLTDAELDRWITDLRAMERGGLDHVDLSNVVMLHNLCFAERRMRAATKGQRWASNAVAAR